ncbi:hypothetical protein QWZ13_19055 [Reinekea marina]|nr:hypothetical protein [Reinekea marina]MDN3651013.1 hypothetical protein [Reinekea marina]
MKKIFNINPTLFGGKNDHCDRTLPDRNAWTTVGRRRKITMAVAAG